MEVAMSSRRSKLVASLPILFFASALPRPIAAQETHELGAVDFQVSCAPEVRGAFDRAVALLHHMMYDESRLEFERIAADDPACAMAHWGVAMTLFQPLWPLRPGPEDLRRGWREVQRAEELAPATERERALVAAAAAFYQEPDSADWWTRIGRWAEATDGAWRARPDDIETSAFQALAVLASGTVAEDRMTHQARAAELLAGILAREPTHPGAIHYTIHANDVEGRAAESLDVVQGYAQIAPSVPHALHMPTHIFIRLGQWPQVVEWNRKSAQAALRIAGERPSPGTHYLHAMDYSVYAQLQQGADRAAVATLREALAVDRFAADFASAFHLAAMPARYALERRAWAEAAAVAARTPEALPWERYPWAEALAWFARGMGMARTGEIAEARTAEGRMEELRDAAETAGERDFATYIEVDRRILAGWIAHAAGDADGAVELVRSAAELDRTVQKHPVSPGALYPPFEALGDLLLEVGRPEEALAAYRSSLEAWPRRYRTLLGAARAARQAGDADRAATYYGELIEVAGEGDGERPDLEEAREFVQGSSS
jgi:tetratricopeptide (TPR) repeat protein